MGVLFDMSANSRVILTSKDSLTLAIRKSVPGKAHCAALPTLTQPTSFNLVT